MAFNDLIQKTNEIFIKIQSVMEKMDHFAVSNQYDKFLEEDQTANQMLNEAANNCDRLEVLYRKEPLVNRSHSKLRVDQLKYDLRHIQNAVRIIETKMNQRKEEDRERELLMVTNFVSNRHGGSNRDDNDADTRILMEHGLEENRRLNSSVSHMRQILESGGAIMNSLTEQRTALHSAHRQMVSMISTMGLSQTVMRMIERRSSQDWIVFCVGCLLIFSLLILLWTFVI